MARVTNFSPGPAALPLAVLEQVRDELTDWHGSGMSVMEISHRSKQFLGVAEAAELLPGGQRCEGAHEGTCDVKQR